MKLDDPDDPIGTAMKQRIDAGGHDFVVKPDRNAAANNEKIS